MQCVPPKLAKGLAEFSVVQVRVLISQLAAGSLGPHHECIHGPLDVRLPFLTAIGPGGHGNQSPIVSLQDLGDSILYTALVVQVQDLPVDPLVTVIRVNGRPIVVHFPVCIRHGQSKSQSIKVL